MTEPVSSSHRDRPSLRAVLLSLAVVLALTLTKLVWAETLGAATPFLLYFIAIVFAAWFGGWRLGAAIMALCAFLALFLFSEPLYAVTGGSLRVGLRLLVFLLEGSAIIAIAARLHAQRLEAATAAERARVGREWFETALRSIGEAVIATDARGRVTFMNPIAEQLTGWPSAEAESHPLSEVFKICREDTREPVENPVERVLREGTIVGVANGSVLIARNGAELAIDDNAAPIRSPSGELVGTVLVFRDVSTQREEERQVAIARREAEQANRAKDEFLAMLGHELRNPLAPIVTALQLMKLRAAGTFEKERTIIERQVRHLVTLVDDLLDVSRITRGKVELAKEPLELAEIVTKALELAAPLIEERQHDVSIAVSRGLTVEGDPVRLAQVVTNLLTNAAKYTPRRGRIEVSGEQQGAEVILKVKDTGLGIEPELLPRIFELFVQGGQPLDRGKGGLGLGLAIVRSVVELHGGRVSAKSEGPGHGSEFEVVLPTALARRARATQPAPTIVPNGARVLVVDDNLDALELLAEALQLKGYEAHVAQDAASALLAAQSFRPLVALLDIGLPVMNGYELARRLRATPGLEGIKLAALTGYGQPSDRERARAAGFDEHLVKPISIDAVQEVVERLVASSNRAPPAL